MTEQQPQQGDTYRTQPEGGRITYDPAWSQSKPWCVFRHGTATSQFVTLSQAIERLRVYGFNTANLRFTPG
jgi:hypothetical protein